MDPGETPSYSDSSCLHITLSVVLGWLRVKRRLFLFQFKWLLLLPVITLLHEGILSSSVRVERDVEFGANCLLTQQQYDVRTFPLLEYCRYIDCTVLVIIKLSKTTDVTTFLWRTMACISKMIYTVIIMTSIRKLLLIHNKWLKICFLLCVGRCIITLLRVPKRCYHGICHCLIYSTVFMKIEKINATQRFTVFCNI